MLDTARTDTAHLTWNERWKTDEGRADWLRPEPDVVEWAGKSRLGGADVALDLGCGVGRHSLVLAALGFETHAFDGSDAGLTHLAESVRHRKLSITTRQGLMTDLPYADASFDYVLAFNVIYHGDRPVVAQAVSEIRRVLKPGGIYQGTMLSKRDVSRLCGREVAPHTFINEGTDDKVHPHFYCSAQELTELFEGFELLSLLDKEHSRPGSWHWHLVAERL